MTNLLTLQLYIKREHSLERSRRFNLQLKCQLKRVFNYNVAIVCVSLRVNMVPHNHQNYQLL